MRTFISGISVLLCGLIFMGAVNAPVMQSQSFYINDHAGVIAQENRDNMLKSAQKLYDETGARAVLLTIENLDGRTPEEYAEAVYNAWELGATGAGYLLLLSTEEKRFAVRSNADITVTGALSEADELAAVEEFDLATSNCFDNIIDSIYNMYLSEGEIAVESSIAQSVPSESAIVSDIESETVTNTPSTESTQDTQSVQDTTSIKKKARIIVAAILFLSCFFMLSQSAKASRKRKNDANYKNAIYDYRRIYSPDEPITARMDDLDYPSGFGGLGNRKAIYMEDVSDADDIGIIKHKFEQ